MGRQAGVEGQPHIPGRQLLLGSWCSTGTALAGQGQGGATPLGAPGRALERGPALTSAIAPCRQGTCMRKRPVCATRNVVGLPRTPWVPPGPARGPHQLISRPPPSPRTNASCASVATLVARYRLRTDDQSKAGNLRRGAGQRRRSTRCPLVQEAGAYVLPMRQEGGCCQPAAYPRVVPITTRALTCPPRWYTRSPPMYAHLPTHPCTHSIPA